MSEDVFVVAKYDYAANESQELSFKKNERFKLIDDSKNWWKVQNDTGNVGFVPSNFVRKESFVDKAKGTIKGLGGRNNSSSKITANGSATSLQNLPRPFGEQNNGSNGHVPQTSSSRMAETSYAVVKFAYEPQRPDEMRLQRGDTITVLERSSDGWWKGQVGGVTGWFPSNYVDEAPAAPAAQSMAPPQQPYAPDYNSDMKTGMEQVIEVVTALFDFEAQNSEELSFRRGETLDIIEKPRHDPEWWRAKNSRGVVGLVPTNYIKVQGSVNNGLSGPYADKDWYFGLLSRMESESLLNQRGREGDFLVRDSETNHGDYSISLKGSIRNMHFWVQVDRQKNTFRIGNRSFNSMEELISHYMSSPIYNDDNTRERLFLVQPLSRY